MVTGSMKSDRFPRTLIVAAFVIGALYFAVFYGIEGCRQSSGPWRVTFTTNEAGPVIEVAQPKLNRSAVLKFPGETVGATNYPVTVEFDRPRKAAVFGRVIYEDLMQLPGVVTLDLFGHEVELMRRTLIVNRRTIPWAPPPVVELWPTNKPATPIKARPSWQTNQ
jgi:hypothetical protein